MMFKTGTDGHKHNKADGEIFPGPVDFPVTSTTRLSLHTGNDNWPDTFLY